MNVKRCCGCGLVTSRIGPNSFRTTINPLQLVGITDEHWASGTCPVCYTPTLKDGAGITIRLVGNSLYEVVGQNKTLDRNELVTYLWEQGLSARETATVSGMIHGYHEATF